MAPTRSVIFDCFGAAAATGTGAGPAPGAGAVAVSAAAAPASDVLTLFRGFAGCAGGAFGSFGFRPGFLRGRPFAVRLGLGSAFVAPCICEG